MNIVPLLLDDKLWVVRRLPAALRDYMLTHRQGKLFLAGGFIRDCISNAKPSDIDLFVPSKDAATAAMVEICTALGWDPRKSIETENAYTIPLKPIPIQIIFRWTFENPEPAIESFDFTIAQAAIWVEGGGWSGIASERFYPDLAAHRLVYTSPIRQEEPGGSFLRMLKFYQRGYRITLESAGALVSRLVRGVDREKVGDDEQAFGRVVSGLLREVDPRANLNEDTIAFFVNLEKGDESATEETVED